MENRNQKGESPQLEIHVPRKEQLDPSPQTAMRLEFQETEHPVLVEMLGGMKLSRRVKEPARRQGVPRQEARVALHKEEDLMKPDQAPLFAGRQDWPKEGVVVTMVLTPKSRDLIEIRQVCSRLSKISKNILIKTVY